MINSNNKGVTNTAVADVGGGTAPLTAFCSRALAALGSLSKDTMHNLYAPLLDAPPLPRYALPQVPCSGRRSGSTQLSGEDHLGLLREALTVFCRVVTCNCSTSLIARSRSSTATTKQTGWCSPEHP